MDKPNSPNHPPTSNRVTNIAIGRSQIDSGKVHEERLEAAFTSLHDVALAIHQIQSPRTKERNELKRSASPVKKVSSKVKHSFSTKSPSKTTLLRASLSSSMPPPPPLASPRQQVGSPYSKTELLDDVLGYRHDNQTIRSTRDHQDTVPAPPVTEESVLEETLEQASEAARQVSEQLNSFAHQSRSNPAATVSEARRRRPRRNSFVIHRNHPSPAPSSCSPSNSMRQLLSPDGTKSPNSGPLGLPAHESSLVVRQMVRNYWRKRREEEQEKMHNWRLD